MSKDISYMTIIYNSGHNTKQPGLLGVGDASEGQREAMYGRTA